MKSQKIMASNSSYSILDIGCGNRPRGTVNVDIVERDVDNFQLANALDLPFDDNSFNTVYSSGISFWTLGHEDEAIIGAWKEAIRVARSQVIFEYNYLPNSDTWNVRHPLVSLKLLQKEVSPDIVLSYSQRGKLSSVIRVIEKMIGTGLTIKLVNFLSRKSFLAKFKLVLENGKNGKDLPETTLEL